MLSNTMVVRRIDDLGRVVIPRDVRRSLGIKEGDKFELWVDEHGVYFKHLDEVGALADRIRVMLECDLNEAFCSLRDGKRNDVSRLLMQAERILREDGG